MLGSRVCSPRHAAVTSAVRGVRRGVAPCSRLLETRPRLRGAVTAAAAPRTPVRGKRGDAAGWAELRVVVGNQCRMRRMFGDVMCWLGWRSRAGRQSRDHQAPARAEGEGGARQVAAKLPGINIIKHIWHTVTGLGLGRTLMTESERNDQWPGHCGHWAAELQLGIVCKRPDHRVSSAARRVQQRGEISR